MENKMRKKGIRVWMAAAFLLMFSPALFGQAPDAVLRITLQQALEIAYSENLTIQVADQEITKQQYAEKGTYAALFPQIDLSGSYSRSIETFKMNGMKLGSENMWSGGVSASVPLVSVPLWKSLKISGFDVELAVEKARSSRIEMTDQVKRAFYAVLLANESYEVFKEVYDNAQETYADIKGKFDRGLVSEYDLIRADVNVKNAEPNLYDAINALELSHWQLKALLGIDLEMKIDCLGELTDYEETLVDDYVQSDFSLDYNSSLLQLDIQQKQLEKARQMQVAQYYPSLNGTFGYQWISMNDNFRIGHYRWNPYSSVGVSLSIPVFSGGKRLSEVRKTQTSQRQLDLQREDTERNLRLSVKQAVDQMSTCVKQYMAAAAGIEQAEKGYAITMKRYETGEGTMLEINDSQLSLTQSRLNLNHAIYNYLVSKSSLERIVGVQLSDQR